MSSDIKGDSITLNLAGVAVRFDSNLPLPPFPGLDAGPFLSSGKQLDIRFFVRTAGAGRSRTFSDVPGLRMCRLFGCESLLLDAAPVRRRLEKALMHPRFCAVELAERAVSVFDFRRKRADFFFDPLEIVNYPPRRLDFGLAAMFLPAFSALILHAAGIVLGGRAILLAAPDGGGKSTAAALALRAGGAVLSDDRTAVRRVRGSWQAFGTPWGRTGASSSAPLCGLFFLEKGPRFELEPVSLVDAVHLLWKDNRETFHPMPAEVWMRAAELFHGLCRGIPAFRLQFPQDQIDWPAVFGAL